MKIHLLVLVFAVLILLMPAAFAFPISPSTETIDFKPNLKYSFTYEIGNRYDAPLNIVMYTKGDLNSSIKLSSKEAVIMPGEWKEFIADVELPESIEKPGIHENRIVAEEIVPESTGVSGKVAVEMRVLIRVPYAGKYIESDLNIPNGKTREEILMEINIANRGKEAINKVQADVDIYDIGGTKVATIKTDSTSLDIGEEKYIYGRWTPQVNAGRYLAKAHITYDENFAELEKEFRIGELLIDIKDDLTKESVSKNSIAKFIVEIESKWNEKIEGAYIKIESGNNGRVYETTSETFSIDAWQTKQIPLYFDTAGFVPGGYNGKATVYYESKTSSREFSLVIKETNLLKRIMAKNTLIVVLITILIVIASINAFQIIKRHRMLKQNFNEADEIRTAESNNKNTEKKILQASEKHGKYRRKKKIQ